MLAVTFRVLRGESTMPIIASLIQQLIQHPSLQGFAIWTGIVGAMIWLPSLVPSKMEGVTRYFCHLGLIGLVGATAFSLLKSFSLGLPSPLPLLELTALGLAAAWSWLERSKERFSAVADQRGSARHPLARETHRDLLSAARLALWLTLSLMPVVRWF